MSLPLWMSSHHRAPAGAPFLAEVARLLGLPDFKQEDPGHWPEWLYETDELSMVWRVVHNGAVFQMEHPGVVRSRVVLQVSWLRSPDPAAIAALIRAYEGNPRRRSLRSLLAGLWRRG
ncbi:hypothetical protein ACIO3O_37035 [Streptomyces sp. NPDC087440]|uniref:hypothetical protein n=1 Tax=Streptomyces sp. NPDC087440 TaxID=3365790 RepID=UPI003813C019